jgi:hypothetical protein
MFATISRTAAILVLGAMLLGTTSTRLPNYTKGYLSEHDLLLLLT